MVLAGLASCHQEARSGVSGALIFRLEKGGFVQAWEHGPRQGVITVLDRDGSVVTSARTDSGGRFRIPLPQGRYRAVGRLLPHDHYALYEDPAVPVPVTVPSGRYEHIRIHVSAYLP